MKKGFYCDKDGEILLITENESNNSGVKSNNSQCIDCIHNDICQFYKALGATVICYPCGFYEAKSNEELFKQALVEGLNRRFDKTIEEAKKVEQIEEMRAILCRSGAINHCEYCEDCEGIVEALYNAGYRKQNVGEWIKHCNTYECSVCKEELFIEYAEDYDAIEDWDLHFCPFCGSKMKGGEE